MGMIARADSGLPSNALIHAHARTVCFRDVVLSGDPIIHGERRPPPARLMLVAYDDGTYGVLLNGHPLPGSPWPEDQLHRCIEAFQSVGRVADDSPSAHLADPLAGREAQRITPGHSTPGHPLESTRISAPT
jgi:hypothetical protein